jgi:hypothetical protein
VVAGRVPTFVGPQVYTFPGLAEDRFKPPGIDAGAAVAVLDPKPEAEDREPRGVGS